MLMLASHVYVRGTVALALVTKDRRYAEIGGEVAVGVLLVEAAKLVMR